MTAIERVKYLIIGNSAGGIGAAEAIRQVDGAGSVLIVSDEPYPVYSRPLISDFLAGTCTIEDMRYRPADFYEASGIEVWLSANAIDLDLDRRVARLGDGRQVAWQKLLLATGGVPIVPAVENAGVEGVFSFTRLDDARAIDAYLRRFAAPVRAVVLGGGLIGVSVTEALVKRGVKVTVVEMQNHVLSAVLDEKASALAEAALAGAGVTVVTGRTVAGVRAFLGNAVTGVSLDDGRTIPCEMVIVAVGVRPRIELARGATIEVNRGILVDRRMETSQPGVYACGDAAEAHDFVYGANRVTPIWPNAYLGGRVAGLNMAGRDAGYPGGTAMNALKYFGLSIVSAGMVAPGEGCEEIRSEQGENYRKVVLRDGVVVGLVFAGDISKAGIVFGLIKDAVPVDGFEKGLVAEDFGLLSLPDEVWRRHLAPRAVAPEKVLVRE